MSGEDFVQTLGYQRASAIVRWHDQEVAAAAMDAAIRAGFRVVEFTLTTPGALELIREYSKQSALVAPQRREFGGNFGSLRAEALLRLGHRRR